MSARRPQVLFADVLQGKGLRETRFVCVGIAGVVGGLESARCACVDCRGVGKGDCASVERRRVALERREELKKVASGWWSSPRKLAKPRRRIRPTTEDVPSAVPGQSFRMIPVTPAMKRVPRTQPDRICSHAYHLSSPAKDSQMANGNMGTRQTSLWGRGSGRQ